MLDIAKALPCHDGLGKGKAKQYEAKQYEAMAPHCGAWLSRAMVMRINAGHSQGALRVSGGFSSKARFQPQEGRYGKGV